MGSVNLYVQIAILACLLATSCEAFNLGLGNLGIGNVGVGNMGIGNKGVFNRGFRNIGVFNLRSSSNIGVANFGGVRRIGAGFIFLPNFLPTG